LDDNWMYPEAPPEDGWEPPEGPDAIARCLEISACAGRVDRAAVDAMVECLYDPDPLVRWEAGEALAETAHNLQRPQDIGQILGLGAAITFSDLLAEVRAGLLSSDPSHRAAAAEALGRWPHQSAVQLLERALDDAEPMVRATAAQGLGRLGAQEAVERLIQLLGDPSLWVRRAAADALGATGDPAAAGPLSEMATQGPVLSRMSMLAALGHLPGRTARRALTDALNDDAAEIRWQAARSLEAIGTSASLPALERLLGDDTVLFDRPVRTVAQDTIRAIGQREQGPFHGARLVVMRLVGRLRRRR
jgi:HEAT repeat protein